jgi:hypothetical protein
MADIDSKSLLKCYVQLMNNPANCKEPINAVLDTASQITICSLAIAQKYKLPIMPTELYVRTATGGVEKAYGQTPKIPLRTEDLIIDLSVLVVENSPQDMLLGRDWFDISGACIDPSKCSLYLGRRTVYCCNAEVLDVENDDPIVIYEPPPNLEIDDEEGRLDAFMEADDNLDDVGYSPEDEPIQPKPKTEIDLN